MKKTITNFAIDPGENTLEQFKDCYSEKFVVKAALMPDAHSGYVAPIGAVLVTKDYVVPSWVGFDIGCGMIAVKLTGSNLLEKIKANVDRIYSGVKTKVPMGLGGKNRPGNLTEKTLSDLDALIEKFSRGAHDKRILSFIKSASQHRVGTLGSGNHFISLNESKKPKANKDEVWLIIHSGSRGLGYKVAEKYMQAASGSKDKKDFEKTFPLKVNTQVGKEYLNILDFGLEFALLNRLEMSYKVKEVLEDALKTKIKAKLWVNKNHNHAIFERGLYVHRKGATPAKKGERGVIPGNMRDGTFLVEGLGNPKFIHSSSHGAGRHMSRKKSRETITLSEFKKTMEGIKTSVTQKNIDEAPMAYKDIFKVMDAQKSSVKVLKHITPIINWQGQGA